MGGWQLEVAKMAMYMSFPVALFHYFNQPEYFEDWVKNTRRQLYPPENKMHREDIQDVIKKVQERHDKQMLEAFEQETK